MGEPCDCKCLDCGESCTLVEETFSYSGTHCTHGKSGTHHTGHYVSSCCLAEYEYIDCEVRYGTDTGTE